MAWGTRLKTRVLRCHLTPTLNVLFSSPSFLQTTHLKLASASPNIPGLGIQTINPAQPRLPPAPRPPPRTHRLWGIEFGPSCMYSKHYKPSYLSSLKSSLNINLSLAHAGLSLKYQEEASTPPLCLLWNTPSQRNTCVEPAPFTGPGDLPLLLL